MRQRHADLHDEHKYVQLPLAKLEMSAENVRRHEITADLDDLAASMKLIGLQQPVVVQQKGNGYEILIGQRRYLAAKQLGWDTIEARVLPVPLAHLEAKVLSFMENSQRRELTARDKSDACLYLFERLGSVRSVADRLGASEMTVRKWLGYSVVPEPIKTLVDQGVMTRPMATRIAENFSDPDKAVAIARKIVELNPPTAERNRIVEAAEIYSDRPVDVILEKSREMRTRKEITFVLPERWGDAIDRAAHELALDAADIAREATIEWLQTRHYGL